MADSSSHTIQISDGSAPKTRQTLTLTPKRKQQQPSGSRHSVLAPKAPIPSVDRPSPVARAPTIVGRERANAPITARAETPTTEDSKKPPSGSRHSVLAPKAPIPAVDMPSPVARAPIVVPHSRQATELRVPAPTTADSEKGKGKGKQSPSGSGHARKAAIPAVERPSPAPITPRVDTPTTADSKKPPSGSRDGVLAVKARIPAVERPSPAARAPLLVPANAPITHARVSAILKANAPRVETADSKKEKEKGKQQSPSGSRHARKDPIPAVERPSPAAIPPLLVPANAPITHARVSAVLEAFRRRCAEEKSMSKTSGIHRIDLKAFTDFKKEEGEFWSQTKENAKLIGSVPGVEVGDQFNYRVELLMVGLHRHLQRGIDVGEHLGQKVATCVVANKGNNKLNDPDSIVYCGEGKTLGSGSGNMQRKPDDAMTGGNLAMKNSVDVMNEVRVVRGLRKGGYVYDGLYEVVLCKEKRSEEEGNKVIEFVMNRKPGQKRINWKKHAYC